MQMIKVQKEEEKNVLVVVNVCEPVIFPMLKKISHSYPSSCSIENSTPGRQLHVITHHDIYSYAAFREAFYLSADENMVTFL